MKVSIIITTYNREKYLRKCVQSILAQTYKEFELIIWDDGSTDNTASLLEEYASDARVRLILGMKNQGQSPALAAAFAKAKGEYLGWVDSDDWLAPTALADTVDILENNSQVGVVYTDYYDTDAQGTIIGNGNRCYIPYNRDRLLIDFMTFHFRLMRRTVYDQVGGIDEYLLSAQDYDLCLKLSEITDFHHLDKPLYFYRNHEENISKTQRLQQIYTSQEVIEKALIRRRSPYRLEVELIGRFQLRLK